MNAILKEAIAAKDDSQRTLTVAVAGNPNAGKTTLFNALTGLRHKVANYPGVTIERKEGWWRIEPNSPPVRVIDLPGLYSLEATSIDETIARNVLLGHEAKTPRPDVVIVAIDATNLVRNLYLLTQLIENGCRTVVALTMVDLTKRNGVHIDIHRLQELLQVSVVPVITRRGEGLDHLARAVLQLSKDIPLNASAAPTFSRRTDWLSQLSPADTNQKYESASHWQTRLINRYRWIENVVNECVLEKSEAKAQTTRRIDALVTHRLAGPVILFLIMTFVFQAIFSWANGPMNLIDQLFNSLGYTARAYFPAGLLTDLIVSGVIPGVGGVVMFLPQIILLFLFITLLEDSGYMARAAFMMDRLMRGVGLHGKAFVPLLSSFACAVPGIMATRTIENPKDRVATIMIAPFMSCSARLPVYTLMIAAFFSGQNVGGFISLGALIILGMYLLGVAFAIGVAWILKHTLLKAPSPPFVMELPPYRLPNARNVLHSLLERVGVFLKRAGTVILAISILLWALVAFPRTPKTPSNAQSVQVEKSYAGKAGRLIEPAISPLGFDWKIGVGLISSFAARETVISTLGIVYNVGDSDEDQSQSLIEAMRNAKRPDGSRVWTPLVALSLMVFFVLACQCMSTVAVVRRETNSWRWPLFMIGYMLVLAYVSSLVTYQGGKLMGFS
jgi:ferrous iron transport protein B